jgi:hypothetical protein
MPKPAPATMASLILRRKASATFRKHPLLDVEAGIREQIVARAHDIAQRRGLDLQFAETFLQIRLRVIRKARRFARPPGHIDPGIVDQEFEAAA